MEHDIVELSNYQWMIFQVSSFRGITQIQTNSNKIDITICCIDISAHRLDEFRWAICLFFFILSSKNSRHGTRRQQPWRSCHPSRLLQHGGVAAHPGVRSPCEAVFDCVWELKMKNTAKLGKSLLYSGKKNWYNFIDIHSLYFTLWSLSHYHRWTLWNSPSYSFWAGLVGGLILVYRHGLVGQKSTAVVCLNHQVAQK